MHPQNNSKSQNLGQSPIKAQELNLNHNPGTIAKSEISTVHQGSKSGLKGDGGSFRLQINLKSLTLDQGSIIAGELKSNNNQDAKPQSVTCSTPQSTKS